LFFFYQTNFPKKTCLNCGKKPGEDDNDNDDDGTKFQLCHLLTQTQNQSCRVEFASDAADATENSKTPVSTTTHKAQDEKRL